MNFLRLLVFCISFHLTISIYSFPSQNIDQEMFEYKTIIGHKKLLNRSIVELFMNTKLCILTYLSINSLIWLVSKKIQVNVGLNIFMSYNIAFWYIKYSICQQAGPWLKALQEKEALLKAFQTSDKSARAGAPSDPLINKGSAHN